MKKRCFATSIVIVLCITMLFGTVAFAAGEEKTYDATDYTLTYTTDESNNATITKFTLKEGVTAPVDVDIPEKISDGGNEYTVTKIGNGAFTLGNNQNATRIRSVNMPDTIVYIGDNAFSREDALVSFSTNNVAGALPSGLTNLGNGVFFSCDNLAVSVVVPGTLRKIGYGAFNECKSLTGITISEGVQVIDDMAFCNTTSVKELVLPSTITILHMSAFKRMQYLKKLYFKCDNVETIDIIDNQVIGNWSCIRESSYANAGNTGGYVWTDKSSAGYTKFYFDNADTLKKIAGVCCTSTNGFNGDANKKYFVENNFILSGTEAGALDNDLYNAEAKTSFAYDGTDSEGNAVISQKFSAVINGFKDGQSTENVDLTNVTDKAGNKYEITAVADSAFESNTTIKTFTPGSALTSIGAKAFYGCTSLESAILNDGLTTLGTEAFRNSGIKHLYYPASITSKNGKVFENCKSLYDICFADDVTWIGNMFYGCDALKKITIPANVSEICGSNFDLKTLDSIYFLGDTLPAKVTDVALKNGVNKTFYVKNEAVKSAVESTWGNLGDNGKKYGSAEIITETAAIAGAYTADGQLYGYICANGIKTDGSYIAVQYDTTDSIPSVSAASIAEVNINANGQAVLKIDASFDKTKPIYLFILERDTIKPLCNKTEVELS